MGLILDGSQYAVHCTEKCAVYITGIREEEKLDNTLVLNYANLSKKSRKTSFLQLRW